MTAKEARELSKRHESYEFEGVLAEIQSFAQQGKTHMVDIVRTPRIWAALEELGYRVERVNCDNNWKISWGEDV
jgi:hypothetical protein